MKGFTLIELMASAAILTILLTVGMPSLGNLLDNYHAKTTLSVLQNTLQQARSLALSNSQYTLVCPMTDNECVADWNQPLSIFTDLNNNKTLDDGDIFHLRVGNENTHGFWQKKRISQNYIKFTPQGHAFSSATTFLYCPHSGKQNHAKQLVINFQGRIRINSYLSQQGTPYTSISPLTCPPP